MVVSQRDPQQQGGPEKLEVTLKLRLRSKVSMVKTAKGWRCHAARWRRVWRRERLRYR